MRILIVEDEPAIADTLIYALQTERFEVDHALTGGAGLELARGKRYDLVVLDIGLPDMTGLDVCKEIRISSQVPVLFLTARDAELDRVLGLELGGDDYVTKPFSPREVVARIRAITRRAGRGEDAPAPASPPVAAGLLRDDAHSMRMWCGAVDLELTAHEYKLMRVLMAKPGRVFTRDQLLEQAWEDPGAVTDRTIDAHIKTIRSKLRQAHPGAQDLIQTRRGLGYSYAP